MSTYTPGPWFWDKGDCGADRPHPYSTIYDDQETVIAEVNDLIPEGDDNGRLLAAAPELLEALKEAMRCEACEGTKVLIYPPMCNCYGDPVCTHPETEGVCSCCDGTGLRDIPIARAAIAKAIGGSK